MWSFLRGQQLSRTPRTHTIRRSLCKTCRYSVRVSDRDLARVQNAADLKGLVSGSDGVSDVELSGWVRSVRKSSAVKFVDIVDGSTMRPVQAVVGKALAADIRVGSSVRLKGTWLNDSGQLSEVIPSSTNPDEIELQGQDSQPKEGAATASTPELRVDGVEILGSSDPKTNPIQTKYQTNESLRSIPHLRPRTPLNSTLLRFRSDAMAVLSQFFFKETFQQTHPPIITSSDCEGAGEAFSVKGSGKDEFFKDPKYLTVSAQLHLEAMAQALGNVWTLSPTFRAEQSDTSRHLSEFYMLEAEMSFVQDMEEVMGLLQKMLSSLVTGLKHQSTAARELQVNRLDAKEPAERQAFEDLESLETLDRRWRGLMSTSTWPRITYTEAIGLLQSAEAHFEHQPVWGRGIQSEHERYLAEKIGYDEASDANLPVFVTQYPREIKAFYMSLSENSPAQGPTVDCFDLLLPTIGELAGGSMREHRLNVLEDNMRLHGLQVPNARNPTNSDLGWYLDLRRWGCPPHGGFGLGFDRLLSYLTGVQNVRDVVPFPRHFGRCDC